MAQNLFPVFLSNLGYQVRRRVCYQFPEARSYIWTNFYILVQEIFPNNEVNNEG